MPRLIYCIFLYLLSPLVWLRLRWRSRRQPAYREYQGERWACYPSRPDSPPMIWIHAVSVGETRAAQTIIEQLLVTYPKHRLLLTSMTPTGRETGAKLFGERVIQAYLPYDYPGAVSRFLSHFRPSLGILMETEIWPNLLAACRQRKIPVILINARLSSSSARGYERIGALIRPALAGLAAVAAQTPADAQRLAQLGARHPQVLGNLKFDITPAPALLTLGASWRQVLGNRPVWLAASSRAGEEPLILDAMRQLKHTEALLILVPRHPQRFDEVDRLLAARCLRYRRRSQGLPDPTDQVWLGDSMGEMGAYYRLADLAFIGGSLVPLGGQNLIEAAACNCPVLVGPYTFNFTQATTDAIDAGAARRVANSLELAAQVDRLLTQTVERQSMAQAAGRFTATNQGATTRTLALITSTLAPTGH